LKAGRALVRELTETVTVTTATGTVT